MSNMTVIYSYNSFLTSIKTSICFENVLWKILYNLEIKYPSLNIKSKPFLQSLIK